MRKKIIAVIAVIVLLAVVGGSFAYINLNNPTLSTSTTPESTSTQQTTKAYLNLVSIDYDFGNVTLSNGVKALNCTISVTLYNPSADNVSNWYYHANYTSPNSSPNPVSQNYTQPNNKTIMPYETLIDKNVSGGIETYPDAPDINGHWVSQTELENEMKTGLLLGWQTIQVIGLMTTEAPS